MRKMYICPTCKNVFKDEKTVVKHSLKCWRERNPNHKSQPAPYQENVVKYQMNEEISNFFASFRKE